MKSWTRRFALLAVMGSMVGGIVVAGCAPATPPEEGDVDVTVPAPDVEAPAPDAEVPPADAPVDEAPAPEAPPAP